MGISYPFGGRQTLHRSVPSIRARETKQCIHLKSLISTTSLALLPRESASLPSRDHAKP